MFGHFYHIYFNHFYSFFIFFIIFSSSGAKIFPKNGKLDDGWPESEKDVFQAALMMVVVKDSR